MTRLPRREALAVLWYVEFIMRLGLRAALALAISAAATACAAVLGIEDGLPQTDGGGAAPDTSTPIDAKAPDVGVDAADAAAKTSCDPFAPFGVQAGLVTLNTPTAPDVHPRLTPDELTIVFASDRLGTFGGLDLYTATRASSQVPFNGPANLGFNVNSKVADSDPTLSPDGKTLYFASQRGLMLQWDLWASVRPTPKSAFGVASTVVALDTPSLEWSPFVTSTGAQLLFASNRGSANTLIYASDLTDGGFSAPAPLSGMTDAGPGHDDRSGALSLSGLVLYFSSNRAGSSGFDIWVTTRTSTSTPFGAPKQVSELNTPGDDYVGWISNDLCRIYLSTNKSPNNTDFDMFVAERPL